MTMALPEQGLSQVRVRLTSRDQTLALENTAPILVPTTFRRYALSTLVNGLLKTEKPVPLEFLINGTYLRTTLDEYLTSQGISAESILNVEYVRARLQPQYVASFEHEDWLSSLDFLSASTTTRANGVHLSTLQPKLLTSSYDGYLRVWNPSGQVIATSPGALQGGHSSFIKSAQFINSTQIVSAGFDRTVRIWKFAEGEDQPGANIIPSLELLGHKSSVDHVCAHAASHRVLSASADHAVGLWSTQKKDGPAVADEMLPNKKRKLSSGVTTARRGPLALMQQHSGPVSAAVFDQKDSTVAYSVSWDQTVRTWDLVTAALVDTRTTSNALFCVEQMAGLSLIATGSAGRDVKLVDPRQSATSIIAMNLRGHKNSVVSLARDPTTDYTIVSGSHDGTCRVWDLRSTRNAKDGVTGQSLYTLTRESLKGASTPSSGEGVKVFTVAWDAELGILSGGEDKMVQINRPAE